MVFVVSESGTTFLVNHQQQLLHTYTGFDVGLSPGPPSSLVRAAKLSPTSAFVARLMMESVMESFISGVQRN